MRFYIARVFDPESFENIEHTDREAPGRDFDILWAVLMRVIANLTQPSDRHWLISGS